MNNKFELWKKGNIVIPVDELPVYSDAVMAFVNKAKNTVDDFINSMIDSKSQQKFEPWKPKHFIGVMGCRKIHTLIGLGPNEFRTKYAANMANKFIVKMIQNAKRKA